MKPTCANQSAGLTTSTELLPVLDQRRLARVLASEYVGAGKPVGHLTADDDAHLLRSVELADVVPTPGLCNIAMQVLVDEVAEHFDVDALKNSLESLYTVRVRHASHILSDAVLHAAVWSVQAIEIRCLVGEDYCNRFRSRMHEVCQCARIRAMYRLGRHLVRLTVSGPYH